MPETAEDIQKSVDNYQQTVGSILAFAHTLDYECKFKSIIGKKLRTSPNNRISPDNYVTPDLVSVKDKQGILTEVKKNTPKKSENFKKNLKQLEKYDDELSEWNGNGKVTTHDIVLLTHHTRSNKLERELKAAIEKGTITLKKNLSIIEFVRNSEKETFFDLKLTWGKMSVHKLQLKLEDCISVAMRHLIKKWSSIKFYDAEPHVVYTMSILWDNYISNQPTNEQRRASARTNKTIPVLVDLDKAHKTLMDLFGPKQTQTYQGEIPKRLWIKNALDVFCKLKIGMYKGDDTYEIKFRNIKNTMEHFSSMFADRSRENLLQFFPAN